MKHALVEPCVIFNAVFCEIVLHILYVFRQSEVYECFSPLLLALFHIAVAVLLCKFLGALLYVRAVIAVLRKSGSFIAQKQLLITNIQGECKFIYLIACIVDIEFTRDVVSCH